MKQLRPILASHNIEARLLDLAPSDLLSLVAEGLLPGPRLIGTYERWNTIELIQIAHGQATEGFSDVDG